MDPLSIDSVVINGSVNWSVRKAQQHVHLVIYMAHTLIMTQLDPWVDPNSHQLEQTGNNPGICLSSH